MPASAHDSAARGPDRSSPFVLDTRVLGRRPGMMREVRVVVPAPGRIGLDLIAIPEGVEVELDLRLESVSEGILVTGSIHSEAEGECVRCLEPFTEDVDVAVTELFAYRHSATDETTDEDEMHRVVDDLVDVEPVVYDEVGLALPLQPVCSPDCPGLCPECGIRLAIADSGHSHVIIDDRWAALLDASGNPDAGDAKSEG